MCVLRFIRRWRVIKKLSVVSKGNQIKSHITDTNNTKRGLSCTTIEQIVHINDTTIRNSIPIVYGLIIIVVSIVCFCVSVRCFCLLIFSLFLTTETTPDGHFIVD